jgi:hypothetical protein
VVGAVNRTAGIGYIVITDAANLNLPLAVPATSSKELVIPNGINYTGQLTLTPTVVMDLFVAIN